MNLKAYTHHSAQIAALTARIDVLEEKLAEVIDSLARDYQRKRGPKPETERDIATQID